MKSISLTFALIISSICGFAQIDQHFQVWSQLSIEHQLKSNWHLKGDINYRTTEGFERFRQSLVRGIAEYPFKEKTSLEVGYAWSVKQHYREDLLRNEHRFHLGIIHILSTNHHQFNFRFRVEERNFIGSNFIYQIRPRILIMYKIQPKKSKRTRFYLSSEVFFASPEFREIFTETSRSKIGIEYHWNEHFTTSIDYNLQFYNLRGGKWELDHLIWPALKFRF